MKVSFWLAALCVLAATAHGSDQNSKEAAEGDIVIASISDPLAKASDGSDISVYSPSGILKNSIHIPFAAGDATPSLGISGSAEYIFYGSSTSNGYVAVIQVAGGTPKYIGKFKGGPGFLQTSGNALIASGDVSSDGAGFFFVSQGVGSKACPLSENKSIATQIVQYRFTPALPGRPANLTVENSFDAYRSTNCSESPDVVLALRTIGNTLYAVLQEPSGTYTMRSYNAFSGRKQTASAPIVTYSANVIVAVTIDSPTSFVAQGLKPNVMAGLAAVLYQLRVEKGKAVVYGTLAPGKPNSNSVRLYAGGLSSFTDGKGIVAATGALNDQGYGPVGNSIYRFDANTLASPKNLFTINQKSQCEALLVVPKRRELPV